jgi:hypothetical protein
MAESVPRAVISSQFLDALRAEKPDNVIVMLEFDVDNGLNWGGDLLEHPISKFLDPVWGISVVPSLEGYMTRLADYRKKHPSLMKPDAFDNIPPEKEQFRAFYQRLAEGARDQIKKNNDRVNQYASKP